MPKGLRAGDAQILQRLCGTDTRLFLRLGALMQARLAVTQAALETLLGETSGRTLLNDRRLKDTDPAGFTALASEAGVSGLDLILIDETDSGWRIIALNDEIGNPLLEIATPAQPISLVAEVVESLTPALRIPVEGLLAARADDQRAAALEQLRYAMPPLAVVSELMPMLLTDGAELVRERAIGLLVGAGAHVVVVDLIRALQRRDEPTLMRLGEALAHLSAEQQDVAIAALLATCARGQASPAVVALCCRLARPLATFRHLPRLIEMLLPTRFSLFDLVRALQFHDQERIDGILTRLFGQGSESDTTLIILLAHPDHPQDPALLTRGLDLLLAARPEPVERMALAGALRRLDIQHQLPGLLAARTADIPASFDTSVHWLIAELCRDGTIVAALADQFALALRHWLREAPGPHLVATLEQQLPALLPASDAVRATLVEPLVEVVSRFRDERSADLVEGCLTGLGQAASGPLWQLIEDHPQATVRLLAIGLMPGLVERSQDPAAAATTGARRLLSGLTRAEQAEERGALVAAAARLAVVDGVAAEIAASVDVSTAGLGLWAIEALSHLATGPHCPDERRTAIVAQFLDHLCEDLPSHEPEPLHDAATDEMTYVIDERLAAHTENVPRILAACGRIGRSPLVPGSLLATMMARLCEQWRLVSGWHTIWGPANIQELGRLLGSLAEQRTFPGPLRIRVAEALLPRLRLLTIARSLARLFAMADGPYLSGMAGKAATQFIQLVADGYYADDEGPDLVEVLVDLLAIPHLGSDGDAIRRRLASLITGQRAHCTSRARAKLRAILPDLAEDLRSRMDWA